MLRGGIIKIGRRQNSEPVCLENCKAVQRRFYSFKNMIGTLKTKACDACTNSQHVMTSSPCMCDKDKPGGVDCSAFATTGGPPRSWQAAFCKSCCNNVRGLRTTLVGKWLRFESIRRHRMNPLPRTPHPRPSKKTRTPPSWWRGALPPVSMLPRVPSSPNKMSMCERNWDDLQCQQPLARRETGYGS